MKIKLIVSLLLICLVFSIGSAQAQFGGRSCEPVTISGITPDTFECLKTNLQSYGIDVPPGNKGELSGRGITGNFEWDGKSDLTLTITRKPVFISCETADREITRFIDVCKRA
ncbi:hypothetical protein MSBRW_2516 [Methanosarcina barkeri str. Wiesmoor]|uniref:Uncharacterized protein n=2 Tax=Methanosarcina barkeri TaxID=2208 RepID=A0A0E3QN18_METBA|nr:hypothetical protein [Methanosarcina barkeri]AKB51769.1 hypothetical protein MSBRW_2516 [Methanosarcina barkeri str. Wiesmoor]